MKRLVFLIALAMLAGCSDNEPSRFKLTGTVTYDGNPVSFGDVVFTPDGSKGNSGPQGIAHIRDGKYDTSAMEGKGIGGGPTVLKVTAFSGPNGKLLCEVELKADLPKGEGKHDISIPKVEGKEGPKTPEI